MNTTIIYDEDWITFLSRFVGLACVEAVVYKGVARRARGMRAAPGGTCKDGS